MWLDALIVYFWLLMWAPGPPMGPDHPPTPPEGQTVSSRAQGMDPDLGNKGPGPNGYHCAYQGNSNNATPNQGDSDICP